MIEPGRRFRGLRAMRRLRHTIRLGLCVACIALTANANSTVLAKPARSLAHAAAMPGAVSSGMPTVEQLKARLASAGARDRPKLCVQIAQQQLAESARQYAANEPEKAQAALTDVVGYSEQARDYSIRAHKNEKQTEIAVRGMTRKLNDMLHTLTNDEQPAVHDAIEHLQRVRDDLLTAMFPKGAK